VLVTVAAGVTGLATLAALELRVARLGGSRSSVGNSAKKAEAELGMGAWVTGHLETTAIPLPGRGGRHYCPYHPCQLPFTPNYGHANHVFLSAPSMAMPAASPKPCNSVRTTADATIDILPMDGLTISAFDAPGVFIVCHVHHRGGRCASQRRPGLVCLNSLDTEAKFLGHVRYRLGRLG